MLQASVVCQIKTWPTSLLSVMLPSASNIMHLPTVSFGYIGSLFACRDFSKQILHALAMILELTSGCPCINARAEPIVSDHLS